MHGLQAITLQFAFVLSMQRLYLLVWLATISCAAHSEAAIVQYTFSGIGNGTFNGTSFSDATFTITMVGDTSNISFMIGPHIPEIENLVATVSITGFSSATITDSLTVFNNQDTSVVGYFATVRGDDWGQFNASLATYDLKTSFGPITTTAQTFGFVRPTDHGNLTLFQQGGIATFKATVIPEPEPLPVLGVASFLIMARRRGAVIRLP